MNKCCKCFDSDLVQNFKTTENNKLVLIITLMIGIIIGFILSPAKNGIKIKAFSNNVFKDNNSGIHNVLRKNDKMNKRDI